MTDILDEAGVPVDAKKYAIDKPHRTLIERLMGAGAVCVFRKIVPEDERTPEHFAIDQKLSILQIDRGAQALGGYSILFATPDGMHEQYFDTDSICVDTSDNSELGYIVGPEAEAVVPSSRAARNAARLDAIRDRSVADTRQSVLAT